jgi:hypothetical protein
VFLLVREHPPAGEGPEPAAVPLDRHAPYWRDGASRKAVIDSGPP